ncbi:propanediol dehydratase small subunit PduE [Brooklawnia cerclae]|uniref:Propanediol dehydratase small subunit n=1 Tax=Brooklawnia cerclae TaxID=349934 RepID=A0ABX0SBH3_9ACTN|nr:diol dehydratase small subunit [Brooklawnia cerclae]NIH55689.1 propanediol dehydratase small subunit [Brooklawnia cerclae]
MESEELIRHVMAEVMAKLGTNQATPTTSGNTTNSNSTPAGGTVDASSYPLSEKIPDRISSASGKKLSDFSFDKLKSGELTAADFRIAPETLKLQAEVADSVGRESLGRNMRRAAELIKVPDDELLDVYNSLRPYRSTKAELYKIADKLESDYGCTVNAAFIREAADVYEKRGRLKSE